MRYIEHQDQVCLVRWARLSDGKYPGLSLLHSSLNAGKRKPQEAFRLNQAGMLAGLPDLFLPVARSGFHGFYIEMKSEKGIVTPIQIDIHKRLRLQGYKVEVCRNMESAKSAIILYLSGKE